MFQKLVCWELCDSEGLTEGCKLKAFFKDICRGATGEENEKLTDLN